MNTPQLTIGRRLTDEILHPMKEAFVGKDDVIDLLGVCLVARENLFILGPPGTAKSALVQELSRRIEGRVFDYLLTRFTEPNEIFGPFDIRKLRDGELVTNTEGMLPEATFVFLDELLNANSAILNSLLLALNERVFRRGRETRALPTLMVVGASNSLPEDEALGALFDRFLMRVHCGNVPQENLNDVLVAGWKLDIAREGAQPGISLDDIRTLHGLLRDVDFSEVRDDFVATIGRLRNAGIAISDRRAVKLQRMLAASALLCGRLQVNRTDMWVLRYIWDTEEQQDVLAAIIADVLSTATDEEQATAHPRSRGDEKPDPEALARDLESLDHKLNVDGLAEDERAVLRDQLGLLASRLAWVDGEEQRTHLQSMVDALWERIGETPDMVFMAESVEPAADEETS